MLVLGCRLRAAGCVDGSDRTVPILLRLVEHIIIDGGGGFLPDLTVCVTLFHSTIVLIDDHLSFDLGLHSFLVVRRVDNAARNNTALLLLSFKLLSLSLNLLSLSFKLLFGSLLGRAADVIFELVQFFALLLK